MNYDSNQLSDDFLFIFIYSLYFLGLLPFDTQLMGQISKFRLSSTFLYRSERNLNTNPADLFSSRSEEMWWRYGGFRGEQGIFGQKQGFFVFFLLYLLLGMRTRRIGKDKGLFKRLDLG